MVTIIKPKRPGKTVGVPGREQGSSDADEVVEDGDAHGEDEGSGVHDKDEDEPGRPAEERVRVEVAGFAEEADEEEFGSGVGI